MRTAFIETLERLAEKDKNIFLLNGDLGFSVLEKFKEKFPDRWLNMGVAEANMIGSAAGLALSGKTVFVYSIIPFVTARVFEQVRNDVAMQHANVKIVGVGAGLNYGQLGPTHHAIEDVALMRTLPGMTVFTPGDPVETGLVTKAASRLNGPAYIRIGKKGDPVVHAKAPRFQVGKGIVISRGRDVVLVAAGNMLPVACETAGLLAARGIHASVISIHTVKPLDEKLIVKTARTSRAMVTLEEHSIIGGLGSAVAEVLAERGIRIPFKRFGIRDRVTFKSGSHEWLRAYHGLDAPHIARDIEKLLRTRF